MKYKIRTVKLAKELGNAKAAAELGIPERAVIVKKSPISVFST